MSNKTNCSLLNSYDVACCMNGIKMEYNSYLSVIFATSIVIMILLSPVAVVGNALILAAVWKKAIERILSVHCSTKWHSVH